MSSAYASHPEMNMPFDGAKLALYFGTQLAVILRDDIPGIPYPGHWDLPGGGREGGESPLNCTLRETREELGLVVSPQDVHWGKPFLTGAQRHWFFVASLPVLATRNVVFGDEGQCWALMDEAVFLSHPKGIDRLQGRLRCYLGMLGPSEKPPAACSGGR